MADSDVTEVLSGQMKDEFNDGNIIDNNMRDENENENDNDNEKNVGGNDDEFIGETIPSPTHDEISIGREMIFITLLCFTQLLTQATLSQTVLPIGKLSKHFNIVDSIGEQSWFTASFSLTVGTFILVSGRLGDMFGYKKLYIIAYIVISLSSLITGFSIYVKSTVFFNIFRSFQGLGFSLAFPNSIALIGHYYPLGLRRIIFMCLFGAVAPGGFVIGSVFDNIFTELSWWPWMFWTLCLVTMFMAILAFFVIPHNIGNHNNGNRGSFDYLGSITGASGLILINFAFNQGPNVGWDKVYVYVLFIIGILLIPAFFLVEKRAKNPLIPQEVLKGETGMVLACIFAGWSSFGIWLLYGTRQLLELDGTDPFVVNARLAPALIMGFVAAGLTAVIIRKIPVLIIMLLSMIAFLTGNILIGTRHIGQIYWGQFFISTVFTPFGMDMSFPAATIILSHNLPKHQQGVAASLVATFVNYSISIGLGFAGTVEYYTTKDLEKGYETTLLGIRNASRMGMGLAGLGVVVAFSFVVYQFIYNKRKSQGHDDHDTKEQV